MAVDSVIDRDDAFRRASRHTTIVRSLKWLLPLGTVLTLASYGLFMRSSIKIGWGNKTIEASGITISREALVAHDPRYTGFDKNGSSYEVKAKTAEQDHKQKGIVRLKGIEGHLLDPSRNRTDLKAARGVLDSNTNILEMHDDIKVVSQNGMNADLTRATVHTKESRIVSTEPVVVRMPQGTVRGQAMEIEQKKKQVTFTGGVSAHLQPQPKAGVAKTADLAVHGAQAAAGARGNDAPIDITSTTLLIDDNVKQATFSGKVVARQNDQVLETVELEISYDGQPTQQPAQPSTQPGATPPPDGRGPQQGRLRRLVARQDVVLTRGQERATGSQAEFDAVADKATLLGPVVIQAGADRGATADRADIDNKTDTILLTGNVIVTQQKNVLKGRRLFADRKQGLVQLSSPAVPGLPKGQINARLYQAESEGAAKKSAAAKAVPAKGSPFGENMRGDPSQPVDIDADQLDVDDKKKTATFRGRVKAVQGDYTIQTEELIATYSGDAGLALTPTPGGAAAPPAGHPKSDHPKPDLAKPDPAKSDPAKSDPAKVGAQLQSIVSPKRAKITAKDGQRAEGDQVSFDPKANTARFTGNVMLAQGSMVTAGQCAILDMNSGSMKLVDACGFSANTPMPKGASSAVTPSTVTTGRAQALIFPNQMREEQKAKSKSDGAREGAKEGPRTAPSPAQQPAPPTPAPARPSQGAPVPISNVFGN